MGSTARVTGGGPLGRSVENLIDRARMKLGPDWPTPIEGTGPMATIEAWEKDVDLVDGAVAAAEAELQAKAVGPNGSLNGAEFALDAPRSVPSIWGSGEQVAWAAGEPAMIVAPPGVGKTTLANRLALIRSGVHGGDLLGMDVEVGSDRVLIVAADRPQQARRSLRRMVTDGDRPGLELGLVVWPGPLEFDLGRAGHGQLAEFVQRFPSVDTVILDSLGSLAVRLTDDEVGGTVNRELQYLVSTGVEVAVLHHQRKATADNRRPKALDDVYGSTWLTTGSGSVLLLWGRPGAPIVELSHLKQPAAEVGPLKVAIDRRFGSMSVAEDLNVLDLLRDRGPLGAREVAAAMHGSGDAPDGAAVQQARRELDRLAREGSIERVKAGVARTDEVAYRAAGS